MSLAIAKIICRAIRNPDWFFYRVLLEYKKISITKLFLINNLRSKKPKDFRKDSTLFCIYDLDMCPTTFNVIEYFAVYNQVAKESDAHFHIIIIKPEILTKLKFGSFNEAFNVENRDFRLRNIIAPATGLFPLCSGYSVISRTDFKRIYGNERIYPADYSVDDYRSNQIKINDFKDRGRSLASLTPSEFAINLCWDILGKRYKKLVTITLRNSRYDSPRNSNLEAWAEFERFLEISGYDVVVVPDTENPSEYSPIGAKNVYECFALHLELRAALYQLAEFNFGVANGPLILATLNPKGKITISLKVNSEKSESSNAAAYRASGSIPGEPYFWYNPHSINSVLDDSFENIKFLFELLVRRQI
jgi:hypothetical protein